MNAVASGESLPAVSVVIPSFNQAAYLEDCLLSVLGQNYPGLEILVLDGGSTDGSADILRRYADRLAFWRSAPDGGQSAAINEGMARATGSILCWLNSDDMHLPGTLLDIGRRLRGCVGQPRLVYGATVMLDQRGPRPAATCDPSAPYDAELLTYYDYLVQPSCFWTRALWSAAGPLDPGYHYGMDWEWFLRAVRVGTFEHTARAYSIYRRHPEHKSGQSSEKRRRELCRIVEKHASEYWRKLYADVDARFDSLRVRADLLARWRVPGRRRLLPMLAPGFVPRLKNFTDLATVLNMLR